MRSLDCTSRAPNTNLSRFAHVCRAARAEQEKKDWRETSRPIKPGKPYPAKEFCSNCGLCDTYYIAHVKDACAFLGDGMAKIPQLEKQVHGRERDLDNEDELRFGVVDEMLYARNQPGIAGAQWTGIVTQIAINMLESGAVDAVVCVNSDENDSDITSATLVNTTAIETNSQAAKYIHDCWKVTQYSYNLRLKPKPMVARSKEDILAARGVKPCISPNLNVLATVEALQVEKLLFIGVGCQVQALRSVEKYLPVKKLYVMGTNCVDNGKREGLDKFLNAASETPETALHYEFMQDYRVHIKHTDGHFEYIPYFCLPANDLNDVIAPSCYSCFDYPNAVADLVVGYMGVPWQGVNMTEHQQVVTVRNERGRELLDSISGRLEKSPTMSTGDRRQLVLQTALADDTAKLGEAPDPMPLWLGNILAWVVEKVGPKGVEFAKYSIDYHYIRNFLSVQRSWGKGRASRQVPEFAKRIVAEYDDKQQVSSRIPLKPKQ